MFKLIISFIITAISLLAANEIYGMYRERVYAVKEMSEVIDKMITYIEYGNYDAYTICQKAFISTTKINKKAFSCIQSGDICTQWKNACSELPKCDATDYFMQVGEILGEYDRATQVQKLAYIRNTLRNTFELQKTELAAKRKLYYTVGGFSGIMLLLILL